MPFVSIPEKKGAFKVNLLIFCTSLIGAEINRQDKLSQPQINEPYKG